MSEDGVQWEFDSKGEALDRDCAHHAQGYLELATRYMRLFAWKEAGLVLMRGIEAAKSSGKEPYPLLYYYRAYVEERADDPASARESLESARKQDLRIEIFPFRREDIQVLSRALEIEPRDANAASLLGDILYSRDRRKEALAHWRSALQAQPKHFSVLRDLGMALLEESKNQEALQLLTQASEVRPDHLPTTTLVANLNARTGNPEAARQAFQRALDAKPGNDLLIQGLASVEAQMGNYSRALDLITTHTFEPRHQSYSLLHLYQALQLEMALPSGKMEPKEALKNIGAAAQPPASLGVDDFAALQSSRLRVFEALLLQATGDTDEAFEILEGRGANSG